MTRKRRTHDSADFVGIKNALQTLRQERRFFAMQHPNLATATDTTGVDREFEEHEHRVLRESLERNELGLYRNASLVLACLSISRSQYDSALEHMLDVAFLDLMGATNSLPGHRSFDGRLAMLIPFVVGIVQDLLRSLKIDAASIEQRFKLRWERFSPFGCPPFESGASWRKFDSAIRRR